jgi:hypothetical protein
MIILNMNRVMQILLNSTFERLFYVWKERYIKLKSNIQFWIDIGAYDFIIDTIRDGYKIPFYSVPLSVCLSNNLSATNHTDFVDSAIQDLLERGLIVTCDVQPTVVNPLTVSIHSNGKNRLILDLRVVNKHLWKQPVKYEDMRTATQH